MQRTIVVSAVNLRKGGTLTILRQCLEYLSSREDVHTIALVHDRALCDYPGIEYIEIPWTVKSWAHRLWCEYVTMYGISKQLAARRNGEPVDVWLSLHDTTPRVLAHKREVYCHTSFPFMRIHARDFLMDPKIPLFALLTRWAYRINVHQNDCLIVQQNWFADAMSRMLRVPREKFRVIPPSSASDATFLGGAKYVGRCATSEVASSAAGVTAQANQGSASPHEEHLPNFLATNGANAGPDTKTIASKLFFYASTADCHKNFETLCMAAKILEEEVGTGKFKVILTISGKENRYSKWLYKKWGSVESIDFHGFMSKNELYATYRAADCFVFPSRVETWGLPISEYMSANPKGRMLLADLPYAHETSTGANLVEFFKEDDAQGLARQMKNIIEEK